MLDLDQLIIDDLEVVLAVSRRALLQVEQDLFSRLKHSQDVSESRQKLSEARVSILGVIELLESVEPPTY